MSGLDKPYISNQFLLHFDEIVAKHNGNISELLQKAGLPHRILTHENRLLPLADFFSLLELTSKKLGVSDIAMQLVSLQDITVMGPLCSKLTDCNTVYEGLAVLIKYFERIVTGVQVSMQVTDNFLTIRFQCDIPEIVEKRQYQDYAIATAFKTVRELVGSDYPLRGCFFLRNEENESNIDQYAKFFGCPVVFESDQLAVTVDKRISNISISELSQKLTGKINHAIEANGNLVERVKQVIAVSLSFELIEIELVANSLGYTARTLQRRLKKNNTSFSHILESVRLDQADYFLKTTQLNLQEISDRIGYQNQSSFSRSFKRFYGISPSERRT